MKTSEGSAELNKKLKDISAPEAPSSTLPSDSGALENHFILIDAESFSLKLGLREIWAYRELLFFLTWRDIRIRYKQTLLGASWAVIQPLFTMLLFTLVFGRLAHVPSDDIPYPVFAYAGLLPWTFFSNAITNAGNSLIGSSSLITKVYFPRVIIPAAAVLAGLLDFAIAFLLLIPLLFYYQIELTWKILILPLFVLQATLLALGTGMWLSALNVKYRDVRYALPFVIQLWLFASPVIYPASMVPDRWRWILALNPMTGIIEGFRACLFGRDFPAATILAVVITIGILLFSFFAFRRAEDNFADIV